MIVNTAHAGFNKLANKGIVGRGNVLSGAQRSTFVRAHNQTECNGFKFHPGHLQAFDLQMFKGYNMPRAVLNEVREQAKEKDVILYLFKTYGARDRIVQHGWVITDTDDKTLFKYADNGTHKSWDVVRYMAAALERGYGERNES